MAFQLPDSINNFLQSKGLKTVLNLLQFIPIPGVGAAAKTLETIKDAVVVNDDFQALTPEDKKQFIDLYNAESARMKQQDDADLAIEQARLNDVANARAREIALAQTQKKDWMMWVSGLVGLASFGFTIYATTFISIPTANEKLFDIMLGYVMGVATSIFTYYFGSSKSSQKKDETISNLAK